VPGAPLRFVHVGAGQGAERSLHARVFARCCIARCLSALTFDMRGGRKQAKPDCGRPLDGRVSRLCARLALLLLVRQVFSLENAPDGEREEWRACQDI